MKVFEFHFNPKTRQDYLYQSFHFRPEERNKLFLGDLYIVVEIYHPLPSDKDFLQNLAEAVSKEFYSNPKRLPEESFHAALRKGNQILGKKISSGETRWMGNFHFALININNFYVHFSASGNTRILLLRNEELLDITEYLEEQNEQYYHFKPFSNFGSSKIISNDKFFILTTQVFEKIYGEILEEIVNLKDIHPKAIKKIFKERKRDLKDISGMFVLALPESAKLRSRFLILAKILYFIRRYKSLALVVGFLIILGLSYLIFRYGK